MRHFVGAVIRLSRSFAKAARLLRDPPSASRESLITSAYIRKARAQFQLNKIKIKILLGSGREVVPVVRSQFKYALVLLNVKVL